MSVQFQRNGDGDEGYGDSHVEQSDEFCVLIWKEPSEQARDSQIHRRKCQHVPGERCRLRLVHDP